MFLVTGGAKCGKSSFAEALVAQMGRERAYIATMRVSDDEGRARVRHHRAQREGLGFETVERSEGFACLELARHYDVALLDCVSNLVANELYAPPDYSLRGSEEVLAGIEAGFAAIAGRCDHVVVVTNEVGAAGTAYSRETQAYVELLGRVNCVLAQRADAVVECVAGMAQAVKCASPAAARLLDVACCTRALQPQRRHL